MCSKIRKNPKNPAQILENSNLLFRESYSQTTLFVTYRPVPEALQLVTYMSIYANSSQEGTLVELYYQTFEAIRSTSGEEMRNLNATLSEHRNAFVVLFADAMFDLYHKRSSFLCPLELITFQELPPGREQIMSAEFYGSICEVISTHRMEARICISSLQT